eukprot:scaffold67318_cov48-Phaeocystis_antarctica.AAC.4
MTARSRKSSDPWTVPSKVRPSVNNAAARAGLLALTLGLQAREEVALERHALDQSLRVDAHDGRAGGLHHRSDERGLPPRHGDRQRRHAVAPPHRSSSGQPDVSGDDGRRCHVDRHGERGTGHR